MFRAASPEINGRNCQKSSPMPAAPAPMQAGRRSRPPRAARKASAPATAAPDRPPASFYSVGRICSRGLGETSPPPSGESPEPAARPPAEHGVAIGARGVNLSAIRRFKTGGGQRHHIGLAGAEPPAHKGAGPAGQHQRLRGARPRPPGNVSRHSSGPVAGRAARTMFEDHLHHRFANGISRTSSLHPHETVGVENRARLRPRGAGGLDQNALLRDPIRVAAHRSATKTGRAAPRARDRSPPAPAGSASPAHGKGAAGRNRSPAMLT